MPGDGTGFFETIGLFETLRTGRDLRHWRGRRVAASRAPLLRLKRDRLQALALRAELDALLHVAEGRLADDGDTPRLAPPPEADWSLRPAPWRGPVPGIGPAGPPGGTGRPMGDGVALFHDCPLAEIMARQILGPSGQPVLRLEVLGFRGTFLSLVINLPQEALSCLGAGHVLQLDAVVHCERPQRIFARLNLRQGPNSRAMPLVLHPGHGALCGEFDLIEAGLAPGAVDAAWLDLIFEAPEMNAFTLSDMLLSRRPRAEP